ncbi:MAG: DUF4293 domain-containing protein [Bacteroidia bacterium]
MIQRIQSVYLFVSVIAVTLMFFLPMYSAELTGAVLSVSISAGELLSDGAVFDSVKFVYVPILAFITITLMIVTIFMFNNRPLQIKLARFGGLMNTALLVVLLFFGIESAKTLESAVALSAQGEVLGSYAVGAFLPIVGMILCFLASRAIMKDEAKVRSASRLR